jgi:hypothetical protein
MQRILHDATSACVLTIASSTATHTNLRTIAIYIYFAPFEQKIANAENCEHAVRENMRPPHKQSSLMLRAKAVRVH